MNGPLRRVCRDSCKRLPYFGAADLARVFGPRPRL